MARESHDREDLVRDATAFKSRVQMHFSPAGIVVEVFVGFRSNGAASFYLNQDPVYHFNSSGELRRCFVDGLLLKAESRELVAMQRARESKEVILVSRTLPRDEQTKFCERVHLELSELCLAIQEGKVTVVGTVPSESAAELLDQVVAYLDGLPEIKIADSPRATA